VVPLRGQPIRSTPVEPARLPRRPPTVPEGANRKKLQELLASGAIALEPAPFLDAAPKPLPPAFDFDRVEAMLLGLAVGDALGNTTESLLRSERRSRHEEITHYLPNRHADGRAVGLPSDDTQLAFWTLEQLNADGGLVPAFLRNFKDQKMEWEKAGAHSAGNGALMRIAPVLLPHLARPSADLWADTALAAMITHNDRTSTTSCLAFISLLWSALQLAEPPAPGFWLNRFLEVAGPLEGHTQLEPRFGPHAGRFKGSLTQFVVAPALKTDRPVLDAANEWAPAPTCSTRWSSSLSLRSDEEASCSQDGSSAEPRSRASLAPRGR
jgi:ADP-ribosyl-[dinitrogen reductase] hydrolase